MQHSSAALAISPPQRVQFPDQMALAGAADGGVAGHVAHGVQIDGKDDGLQPQAGGGQRRLDAGVSGADDGNIKLSGRKVSIIVVFLSFFQGDDRHLRPVEQTERPFRGVAQTTGTNTSAPRSPVRSVVKTAGEGGQQVQVGIYQPVGKGRRQMPPWAWPQKVRSAPKRQYRPLKNVFAVGQQQPEGASCWAYSFAASSSGVVWSA